VKIHTRTLIILGVTVFILIFAMNFLAQFFVLSSYANLEEKESFVNLERVTGQIDFEKENLGEKTRDWAVWDDTYLFMTDRNAAYAQGTLNPSSSYESLQVNGILYYDSSGNFFDGRWYTPQNKSVAEVPLGLREYFILHASLLNRSAADTSTTGFILLDDGPYLVAMHPILASSGNGPLRGTLVMVRMYDDVRITKLQDRAHLPVKLIALDERWLNNDPVVLQLTGLGAPAQISRVHDASTLVSSTILPDIEGRPALLLKVTTGRSVYQQALATISLLLAAFLILAVIFVIITELLLRWYIVNPLTDLDSSMKAIGQKRDLAERLPVSGDDEIASLKNSLNAMLTELEDSQHELALQRAQLAEANRKANLYLDIYLDVLTYEIMNAIFSLSGYADILKNSVGDKEKGYTLRMIETIKKSRNVIRNIETISKIYKHPPEQKPVNLKDVVAKEIMANKGISIQCRNCDGVVLADEMLPVVFQNLFSNSIKSGGDAVEIEVSVDDQPDGMLQVSLSDTGTGIPDDMKPGIFDRFLQGSEKRSSYGLGLHIAKMLIEAYGGRIWADDRVTGHPEQGAAIRFTLKKG